MAQDPQTQAKASIDAVHEALNNARSKWMGAGQTLASWIGISPQDQVLGALNNIESNIDKWSARIYQLGATDADGWKRWTADGNDLLSILASTAQDAQASSLSEIAIDTVKATAVTVEQGAVAVAEALPSVGKWAIVGIVAIALGAGGYFLWRAKKGI